MKYIVSECYYWRIRTHDFADTARSTSHVQIHTLRGKGGVGKTTCAAATAIALANRGERTLVVSTDPAHSLGESLGVDLGGSPTEIESELWGVEADATSGQDIYRAVVEAIAADLREAGIRLTDEDVERLFTAGFVLGAMNWLHCSSSMSTDVRTSGTASYSTPLRLATHSVCWVCLTC
ncbi:ArsA-related P-loop ATPase [Halocatena marina]|uniref:ArsA-related P-loop ATPase n=1 Tax=Halocatena marina TaxID=2934937 RepID=A0ABD5YR03_9EURY